MLAGGQLLLRLVEVHQSGPRRHVTSHRRHRPPDVVDVTAGQIRDDVPGHEDPAVVGPSRGRMSSAHGAASGEKVHALTSLIRTRHNMPRGVNVLPA